MQCMDRPMSFHTMKALIGKEFKTLEQRRNSGQWHSPFRGEIVDSGTLRHTRLSRPQGSTNSKLEQQRNSGQWHSPT
ncbi:unnamed protein product [Rodentolepis nana]|uniref:Uncharacterized protein n=1 Tax=Rodentolepis nana TaxID=102285 RepID=A0A3P7SG39_RODNA|nr:unnamed protein product [Rodentolepis nana]